jgi:methyl-accepting chemotaxis protein
MVNKNRIMMYLATVAVFLAVMVHILHRSFHFLGDYIRLGGVTEFTGGAAIGQNVLLGAPIIFLILSFILYRKHHQHVPLFLMLTMTFSSISTIAGGYGLVEYHFSIFFVLACLAYFDSIKLIVISTVIFAVHHLGGYFLLPELICGTSEYRFSLLLIHAIYLILTSGAIVLFIYSKMRSNHVFTSQKKQHEQATQETIANLQAVVASMNDYVQTLLNGMCQTNQAAEQIVASVETMTKDIEKQTRQAKGSAEMLHRMAESMSEIMDATTAVSAQMQYATTKADEGRDTNLQVITRMKELQYVVTSMTDSIQKLVSFSEEIAAAVSVISDLSEQTNMLALNASIEAARAGEHGRGFAIVADEVRKLAQQSRAATDGIHAVITNVKAETTQAVAVSQQGERDMEQALMFVASTETLFEAISDSVMQVEKQVKHILERSEQTKEESAGVTEAVSGTIHTMEEALVLSEDIEGSTKQQLLVMENITHVVEQLSDVSLQLRRQTEKLQELV